MCFSATASFTASAGLSIIGLLSIKKNVDPDKRLFAAIPLLFGIQQFAEGIVWISAANPSLTHLKLPATHVFLFFAFCLWPIWVPQAVQGMEPNTFKKPLYTLPLIAGILTAILLGLFTLIGGVTTNIMCNHILYFITMPAWLRVISMALYLCATVVPFLICSRPMIKFFGVLLGISYFISLIFYFEVLTSVWCFFAAVLSFFVYALV